MLFICWKSVEIARHKRENSMDLIKVASFLWAEAYFLSSYFSSNSSHCCSSCTVLGLANPFKKPDRNWYWPEHWEPRGCFLPSACLLVVDRLRLHPIADLLLLGETLELFGRHVLANVLAGSLKPSSSTPFLLGTPLSFLRHRFRSLAFPLFLPVREAWINFGSLYIELFSYCVVVGFRERLSMTCIN